MALTVAQLNAQLRTLLENAVTAMPEEHRDAFFSSLLRACVIHYRRGDASSQEAARTIAKAVAERRLARTLTAADTHNLRQHWVDESDRGVLA